MTRVTPAPVKPPQVTIVGAGLAGCEAAFQLAERGIDVTLIEQKPHARTPAQTSDSLCELVCSNSMRGAALANAVGLLKEELRRAGSLVLACADATSIPAGGALAVDRERFAERVTAAITSHPRIRVEHRVVEKIPELDHRTAGAVILATGPLTGEALAEDLASVVGHDHLAYYDAIAPIVAADSIDTSIVYRKSRYDKGVGDHNGDRGGGAPRWGRAEGEARREVSAQSARGGTQSLFDNTGDYLNCPMDDAQYRAFVAAVIEAKKVEPRSFEHFEASPRSAREGELEGHGPSKVKARYFEGCLPIEVMAARGEMTLAFGPMKPVGLEDPRTNKRPFAVVQLRQEDEAKTAYNLVGFQTRMTWPEQKRVFCMIPGLENAEFLRLGSVHRNTFVDAPACLDERMQLRARPGVFLAGQVTGVEGYVESCAGGFLCAWMLARSLRGEPIDPPPKTTALGGILTHLSRPNPDYQPSNITWAHVAPLPMRAKKHDRYEAMAKRALADLDSWLGGVGATTRRSESSEFESC